MGGLRMGVQVPVEVLLLAAEAGKPCQDGHARRVRRLRRCGHERGGLEDGLADATEEKKPPAALIEVGPPLPEHRPRVVAVRVEHNGGWAASSRRRRGAPGRLSG
jgi:hypothetical protein